MAEISESNKIIARVALAAFGGKPNVAAYWDEAEKHSVDLLTCKDQPQKGVTSYSTIGLSDNPIHNDGVEIDLRVEFVGACSNSISDFGNIVTTAAFCVINSKWPCSPGMIFPDIVDMYNCSKTLKHLMLVSPFLWEDRLQTLELDSKTVAWLLLIPISEAEYKYAQLEGASMLEALFEEHQIDIFDINRSSVI
ncbi:suppressor of fused domain protein [Vibrio sp. NTOU-M3]|uniref:suppressor of fused domain protein n=1 Tax=Vibrio sp. NTOU-M3 TaxID=3234954 RepID=UPI00349FA63F